MAGALIQPTRRFDSERERLRRRRDRHARLATDRALAEIAFQLRARERQERGLDPDRTVSPPELRALRRGAERREELTPAVNADLVED
jgi:hypothetical protein